MLYIIQNIILYYSDHKISCYITYSAQCKKLNSFHELLTRYLFVHAQNIFPSVLNKGALCIDMMVLFQFKVINDKL